MLPLDVWIQDWVDAFVGAWRPFFQMLRLPIEQLLTGINQGLLAVPPLLLIAVLAALAAWRRGAAFAAFIGLTLFLMGWVGLWRESMTSISIVATTVTFAALIGVPIGILLAEYRPAWRIAKPVLDVMQTTPSFVYLVPVVMLFGIGTVPGAIATIMFATPPLIKLTYLGLVQVSPESSEAGNAFGATRLQLLVHVKLPLALDTIRAGINQTIMLAIVMSSIAAMIGAEGLGLTVLRGIARLDVGMAATGGLCLVLLALATDGLAQSAPRRRARPWAGLYARLQRQPVAAA
ncbi:ABC transporter permease subunit [Verticiella sediminum]|uniref:ABC transporter permease subunit n=2 Tax=Verticiella sediminum TaxID=1247510 RepID=A0A556AWT1_9BURK|nr:ABC transporter permease subunit [Verticiella sediminum]